MHCPKCDALQDDAREECASCGIVFAKWRPPQRRAAEPPLRAETRTSPWLVGAAVVIVSILGMTWTAKRKADRAKRDPVAELHAEMDRINAKGLVVRQRLAQEAAEQRRSEYDAQQARAPKFELYWPEGLTADQARDAIQRCSGYGTRPVRLPRSYHERDSNITERYPWLESAARNGLVDLELTGSPESAEGRLVTVRAADLHEVGFTVTDSEYVVDRFYRVFGEITSVNSDQDGANVDFAWRYEPAAAARLFPHLDSALAGSVIFEKQGRLWRAVQGEIRGPEGPVFLCR